MSLASLGSRSSLLNLSHSKAQSRRATLIFIFSFSFTCTFMFLLGLHSDYAFELLNARISRLITHPPISFLGSSEHVELGEHPFVGKIRPTNAISLGVASELYVISLRNRTDRRSDMETLRKEMGLQWSYIDALGKDEPEIDNILTHVQHVRNDIIAHGEEGLPLKWVSLDSNDQGAILEAALKSEVYAWADSNTGIGMPEHLLCATEDSSIPVYTNQSMIPPHMHLSRGMIACWFSHMSLLRQVLEARVNDPKNHFRRLNRNWERHTNVQNNTGTIIVFEDDIDMEWDLRERLERMWPDLPPDWDIVFLGHCWSPTPLPPITPTSPLHPSLAPKCTHAYALSDKGLIHLLAHLSQPRFAYSRALDQAIAWLVQSGKLRAFSVVPSVVIQRKLGKSDVWEGDERGSTWREDLVDSAFSRIAKESKELVNDEQV